MPDVEIACFGSAERFDDNKAYLEKRAESESNLKVKMLLKKEEAFLDGIKRLIALYFDASLTGENIPDYDGKQYFDFKKTE